MKIGGSLKERSAKAEQEGWFRRNTNGGLCHCGCGEKTTVAVKTSRHHGQMKGFSVQYVKGHLARCPGNQLHETPVGKRENSPRWKGGRRITKQGYVEIWAPDHPHAHSLGYIFEHRLVMEQAIGRYLRPEEVVHHRDHSREARQDNRISNLMLFATGGDHSAHHQDLRRRGLTYG